MIDKNNPLVEAARYGDAAAEEHGLINAVVNNGMDMDALQHLARQRALRLAILMNRGPAALREMTSVTERTVIQTTPAEQDMIEQFTLAYLDGMFIGWLGRRLSDER